jgi:hypothetical protein
VVNIQEQELPPPLLRWAAGPANYAIGIHTTRMLPPREAI